LAVKSSSANVYALLLAVVAVMFVLDWFYGTLTKGLVLGQATINVTSVPGGAQVFADTQLLGVTPLAKGKVLPGDYVLRVEHPHYDAQREKISVTRGDTVERSLSLVRGAGTLVVLSNPRGAAIRLNGEPQSEITPATFNEFAAGNVVVEVSLFGRKTVTQEVELLPQRTLETSAELNPVPMGALSLEVEPAGALVELKDVLADNPLDYAMDMMLPLADYSVRVSHPGYAAQEQNISLRRGPNRLKFALERHMGLLTVAVTPADADVSVRSAAGTQRYNSPVSLPVGEITVQAEKLGFRSRSKRIDLSAEGAQLALDLPRFSVKVGRVFSDPLSSGGNGPQVVVLGAGSFRMGDLSGAGSADERPAHKVQLRRPFAMGVREVSNAEFRLRLGDAGDNLPATRISRDDVSDYLAWLSRETSSTYRLPTEAEWEYAARAGSQGAYGAASSDSELCTYGNVADQELKQTFRDYDSIDCHDGYVRLAPVGSFAANAFGLFDMIGNASEWVADCWHDNYSGAPADGRAWGRQCSSWVERGGAWGSAADKARVSHRAPGSRPGSDRGFRVVREL